MLQFKSPWPSSVVDTKYKFSINTLQHVTLEQGLGLRYPDAVFYVLPLFTRWDKVNQYAPRLASDTWMLRATDIDSTALGFTQQRHRVEVVKNDQMPVVSVFSPVVDDLEVLNAQQVFHEPDSSIPKSSWIPSAAIQEWAEGIMSGFEPKRLRGLHSLFLPMD